MKVERKTLASCGACKSGKPQVVFKLDRPTTPALLEVFKANNFKEATHFTKAGMLYVDNNDLVISSPMGSDKLSVKCKDDKTCDQKLNDLEDLLTKIG